MGYNPFIFLITLVLFGFAILALIYPFAPFRKRIIALIVSVVAGFACFWSSPLFKPTKVVVRVPATIRLTESGAPIAPVMETMWVTAGRLNKRSCPGTNCGKTGSVFNNEAVNIFEWQNGWARISGYADAECADGQTAYIEAGPNTCDEANGIIAGQFASWVAGNYLTDKQP